MDKRLNCWYDFGLGIGGNLITLLMLLNRFTSIGECFKHLEELQLTPCYFSFDRQRSLTHELRIVEVKPLQHPALIGYLSKRCLNVEIAKRYCKEVHYTVNGKVYFAIGFRNDKGGYELRSCYFKGGSSPKAITTLCNGYSRYLLFEGFMDSLSYLTLKGKREADYDVIVLNSVSHVGKVSSIIPAGAPIYSFLDNDAAGVSAYNKLRVEYGQLVNLSEKFKPYKDLNDYLINRIVSLTTNV